MKTLLKKSYFLFMFILIFGFLGAFPFFLLIVMSFLSLLAGIFGMESYIDLSLFTKSFDIQRLLLSPHLIPTETLSTAAMTTSHNLLAAGANIFKIFVVIVLTVSILLDALNFIKKIKKKRCY